MKDKICASINLILIVAGTIIGLHDDWTQWVLLIPFGWVLLGGCIDELFNSKAKTNIIHYNTVLCTFLLVNVATIFVHRDTAFIIGRFICCIGLYVFAITTPRDVEIAVKKESNEEIERLRNRCELLESEIDSLLNTKKSKIDVSNVN